SRRVDARRRAQHGERDGWRLAVHYLSAQPAAHHRGRQMSPHRFIRETLRDIRQVARGWRWGRRPLVPRSAAPYQLPAQQTVFPTAWARTPMAKAVRDVVQKIGLDPLLRSTVTPQIAGLDVFTRVRPPVIFVANHSSHLDTAMILCSL